MQFVGRPAKVAHEEGLGKKSEKMKVQQKDHDLVITIPKA